MTITLRALFSFLLMATYLCECIAQSSSSPVEQWGIQEIVLSGPSDGDPFLETVLAAEYSQGERRLKVNGFYDGDGTYRVRFMPDRTGEWRYETTSNVEVLNRKSGTFSVGAPKPGNHGPVRVQPMFHFAYADGCKYVPIGTTCYAWTHQNEELEQQTLQTLRGAPFNKLRMCVFPKNYAYNTSEPPRSPFAGTGPRNWDLTRFNPDFFRHLERRVGDLRDLRIEADLILFHPYDEGRWGFDRMPDEVDDRYLRYVIARLGAYRNVWWSLANEFDFMKEKQWSDWDRLIQVATDADPFDHLCSIHNGRDIYNHNNSLLTHASIQNGSAVADFGRAVLYRDAYRKPIVFDEVKYEGNIEQRWGNLSAQEMVHRFWLGTIAGTYVGHGETYRHPEQLIWWAKGGELHGESPARIAFLRRLLEEEPAEGIEPIDKWQNDQTAGKKGSYYWIYLGKETPHEWAFHLPQDGFSEPMRLAVEVIDAWNMTIQPLEVIVNVKPEGKYLFRADPPVTIPLPGRPYQAIRLKRL